jgi:hypothetical protein
VRYGAVGEVLCSHLPEPVDNAGTGAVTRVQVLRNVDILHFS